MGVFVESAAADMGCEGKGWTCSFQFIGERVLDFEVFMTNSDGNPLDATGHMLERRKYVHECFVEVDNISNLHTAELFVDDNHFNQLPIRRQPDAEPGFFHAPQSVYANLSDPNSLQSRSSGPVWYGWLVPVVVLQLQLG